MSVEDPSSHDSLLGLARLAWPLLGGLGGAIVSLGLARNAELSGPKKAFNVLAGTICAIFVGPLIVRWTLGHVPGDSGSVGAVYCLTGLAATSIAEHVVAKIRDALDMLPISKREKSQ